ncbi:MULTISPECIES: 2,3,4,5-tetrahydropyridine-2,6-dicarboxylate N-succinyltransferase [spotted fever group]|uniref:2,3,4,5-tetrahydropyridine-2,6-dicarboxylate N-succinyltransferase n=1 Tax=Rickettsia tamurae subsp. buchneri TaxID=1462938 RepID=A0A8E0WLW3_9RICK|nr:MULTISPECIES: 2,3,4,5-tetrahydropyridine-2,6-dicarboxylate N-succinyltransferase [spotted fever group]EER22448.1 2,3,4,5-tetrahydropyridine-2,6-dicarboxylate N-succinyltransferase [Rickettsia endosymbiont of Ixodes scapularis]KDO03047.1 2,3,4,5-tetrahydropyridine-2,6-dicarboxylate N-succinyltransferase [Rickettsia tamurae subsp. buchneri]
MSSLIKEIEEAWQIKDKLLQDSSKLITLKKTLNDIIEVLNQGTIRVCEKQENNWQVNEWVKKAILLYFITTESQLYNNNYNSWYDKVAPKFSADIDKNTFKEAAIRKVPGAVVRTGTYIAKNVVIMPSFINIGAYIDEGTMIDTWATIGSCAQIGKNCHISGGTGIGGVLEPLQAKPVIIEDNCFIGARSEIAEGVIVEEGAVISMGVFIGSSTKIVYRDTGEIIYGRIPAYSVVVPGVLPAKEVGKPGLYCVVIVKQVDKTTRAKVSINDLLRM